MSEIMIYAQVTQDNYLHTVVFELANKAQELAKKLNNATVSVFLICKNDLAINFKEAFQNSGIDKVFLMDLLLNFFLLFQIVFYISRFPR